MRKRWSLQRSSAGVYQPPFTGGGTFTWPIPWLFKTLTAAEKPFTTVTHLEQVVGLPELRGRFSEFHRSVLDLLSVEPASEVIWNDIFDVPPLHAYTRGRVVLLGDAAHAVTPDLGQGACQALEDAAVLSSLLARPPFEEAFARFDSQRLARTRRLVRDSRRFGRIAQLSNPVAVWLRNGAGEGSGQLWSPL